MQTLAVGLTFPEGEFTWSKRVVPSLFEILCNYRGADKSLVRHTYRCMLFDGENISFDASPVIYVHKQ
jgi:hypothetical protein